MKNYKKFLNIIYILALTNCATFSSGHTFKEIEITTTPPDAYVYIDGWIVKTPAKVNIKNDRSHVIMAKKDGYKDEKSKPAIGIRYKEVFFGNIIWTFAYPFVVALDIVSGSAFGVADTNIILEEDK